MEVHIGQRVKRRASVAQTRTTGKEHVLGTVVRAAEKSGWVVRWDGADEEVLSSRRVRTYLVDDAAEPPQRKKTDDAAEPPQRKKTKSAASSRPKRRRQPSAPRPPPPSAPPPPPPAAACELGCMSWAARPPQPPPPAPVKAAAAEEHLKDVAALNDEREPVETPPAADEEPKPVGATRQPVDAPDEEPVAATLREMDASDEQPEEEEEDDDAPPAKRRLSEGMLACAAVAKELAPREKKEKRRLSWFRKRKEDPGMKVEWHGGGGFGAREEAWRRRDDGSWRALRDGTNDD